MNDDLLLAAHERAARARLAQAARDLRANLAPAVLTRRAIRARPLTALAIGGAGGARVGAWLASTATPGGDETRAPQRRSRTWLRLLTQVSQVVAALAAGKAVHAQAGEPESANV